MKNNFRKQRGARRPFLFYVASLGCPKNTVDSNSMAVLLQREGYRPTLDSQAADIIIVNTCGFIEKARQESLDTLRELADTLRPGQHLVAAGCWAQRAPEFLVEAVPQLDAVLGTRTWQGIVPLAQQLLQSRETDVLALIEDGPLTLPEEAGAPGYAVSGASAFLKIADGCSRKCAFCAIPAIKGGNVSRSEEAILADARELRDMGVLEINLIAQDSTFYGYDQGRKDGLAELLEALVQAVPEVPWLRILYAFPGYITPALIDVITRHEQVLPYIDIPLQHAHPDVLRRMRRPADVAEVRSTIAQLRRQIPNVALRTTFIVGFPGETDAEFATLLDFVKEIHFDRVGVFTYSHEVGTPAAELEDDVPDAIKEERYDALMVVQQAISLQQNLKCVGKRFEVLLEGVGEGLTVGRSYRDAPEIDGLVLIDEELEPHCMVKVEIDKALEYDLLGHVVEDEVSQA